MHEREVKQLTHRFQTPQLKKGLSPFLQLCLVAALEHKVIEATPLNRKRKGTNRGL
jgi:hypothetical protein